MPKRRVKAGIDGKSVRFKDLTAKNRSAINSQTSQLRVMRINVSTQGNFIKREMAKAGLPTKDLNLDEKVSIIAAKLLNGLSQGALDAVKSKIPVGYRNKRSGLLRDTKTKLIGSGAGVSKSFRAGSRSVTLSREVIILSGPHLPYYRKFPISASGLAFMLDASNKYSRTRSSEAQGIFKGEPKGSPTKWSSKAINAFKTQKGTIVKRILGKI